MWTQIVNKRSDFTTLKDEWNALLEASVYKHLFMTYEWMAAWWDVYGDDNELFIIIVRNDNGKLVAIAPLMIKHGKAKKLQFIAHDLSDYMDFIIKDDIEQCFGLIFGVIGSNRYKWDWAEFIYIAKNSPYFTEWERQAGKLGGVVKRYFSFDCVAVNANLRKMAGGWNEFEKKLPPKRRNDLKRCSKLLDQQGRLIFERMTGEIEVKSNFLKFIDYHKKRWSQKGHLSQFSDPRWIAHYLKLNEKMAGKGWLELSILRLDGNYLAFAFSYVYEGRYYYYTPSFNPEFYRYSPGNLLIKYLIVDAYERGIKCFDLLRGDEPYKYVWGDQEIKLYRIQLFRNSVKGTSVFLVNGVVRWICGYLRRYQSLKKIRDRLKGLLVKNVS